MSKYHYSSIFVRIYWINLLNLVICYFFFYFFILFNTNVYTYDNVFQIHSFNITLSTLHVGCNFELNMWPFGSNLNWLGLPVFFAEVWYFSPVFSTKQYWQPRYSQKVTLNTNKRCIFRRHLFLSQTCIN